MNKHQRVRHRANDLPLDKDGRPVGAEWPRYLSEPPAGYEKLYGVEDRFLGLPVILHATARQKARSAGCEAMIDRLQKTVIGWFRDAVTAQAEEAHHA